MPKLSRAESLLTRWGEWRSSPLYGLGHAKMTTVERLLSSPGYSGGGSMVPAIRLDPESARVDGIIHWMTENGKAREVIILWLAFVQRMDARQARKVVDLPHSELYKLAVRKAIKVFETIERRTNSRILDNAPEPRYSKRG